MPGCLVISDFNAQNFSGYLENDEESPQIETSTGPFGQVIPLLTHQDSSWWKKECEFAIVWTLPQSVIPSYSRLLSGLNTPLAESLAEVDSFCEMIRHAATRVKALFVPSWAADYANRGAGMIDLRPESGQAYRLTQMNLRLADHLSTTPNVFVLDAQRWIANAGRDAFSPKLWYQGKIPFNNAVFKSAVGDIKAAIRGLFGQARKLVVVDLDDTLWGGVVGDLGWENLRLGGHDGVGEAFADFQDALKALTRRGILLGIVSKNDEVVALDAISKHPEMRLKREDFAGWRINWQDKAANVAELAAELNLGLQSIVFIDDNPVERARIRDALPEVLVPEWPENPMLARSCLQSLHCFDVPAVSQEDSRRTEAYATERQRAELKKSATSLDEWLKQLEIRVAVEELNAANLTRATQLLNKTNQLNLSTRRLTEAELLNWHQQTGQKVWVFRVSDRLSDSGLTGLASLKIQGDRAEIVDYVLSCRVMGRKVEETLVHWLCEAAVLSGANRIEARYLPTEKNRPTLEFWQRSGFMVEDDHLFNWNLAQAFPRPEAVELLKPATAPQ